MQKGGRASRPLPLGGVTLPRPQKTHDEDKRHTEAKKMVRADGQGNWKREREQKLKQKWKQARKHVVI